jgi:hypothetical protein
MNSYDNDHSDDNTGIHQRLTDAFDRTHAEAASHSRRIIRWLPLLAANDFLEHEASLHPGP